MTWIPRFHLSTALVMMIMAGLMLGLNTRPTRDRIEKDDQIFCGRRELIENLSFPNSRYRGLMTIRYLDRGWPLTWLSGMDWIVENEQHFSKRDSEHLLNWVGLFVDFGVALFSVVVVGFLFEHFSLDRLTSKVG